MVLTSYAETYGMAVTEALARGIPVLATDVGGLPEAVGRAPDGGVPGILVPPENPAALAAELRGWFGEADVRRRLEGGRPRPAGRPRTAGRAPHRAWRRYWAGSRPNPGGRHDRTGDHHPVPGDDPGPARPPGHHRCHGYGSRRGRGDRRSGHRAVRDRRTSGTSVIPGAGPAAPRPGERATLRLRDTGDDEPARYAPEWLQLREPADAAARSYDLLDPLRIRLANLPRRADGFVIHDIGCGTGSMGRWLAPRLDGAQHWVLHDRDPYLLHFAAVASPRSAADGSHVTVETRRGDVGPDHGGRTGRRLPGDRVRAARRPHPRGDRCSRRRLCRGRLSRPADAVGGGARRARPHRIRWTRRSPRRSTPISGGAVCSGRTRSRSHARRSPNTGATVRLNPSPWRLGPEQAALTEQWLRGWVGAAVEERPELATPAEGYLAERLEACAAGELRVVVQHSDLLAPVPAGGRVRMSGRGRGRLSALAAWLNTRTVRTRPRTLAGVVILGVLFWRLGTGALVDGLRRIDGATLAAALGIGLVTTVFSAWRWALVARGIGIRLPLRAAVADYYRALFLNAALPGGVLGDVHRAVRHGKEAGDLGRGVRAVVLERTAGQLALFVAGGVVLATVPSPVLGPVRQVAPRGGTRGGGGLCGGSRAADEPGAAARPARGPGPGLGGADAGRGSGRAAAPGGACPAFSCPPWWCWAGTSPCSCWPRGWPGGLRRCRRLLPLAVLALLAMGLPLNVGGWGPREGVTAWAFGAAGLGAGVGFTVAVVYGVLSLVASLPGVVVLVVRWYGGVRSVGGRVSVAPAAPSLPVPGGGAPGPPAGLRPRPQTPDGLAVGAPPLPQAPDGPGVAARARSQAPDGLGVGARPLFPGAGWAGSWGSGSFPGAGRAGSGRSGSFPGAGWGWEWGLGLVPRLSDRPGVGARALSQASEVSREKYGAKESVEACQEFLALFRRGQGRAADDAGIRIGGHTEGQEMAAVVRDVVGGLITGAEQFGMSVQKDGGLDFARVHVGEERGDDTGALARRLPVLRGREQGHLLAAGRGFLNGVAQDVVSAVPVDQYQGVHARPAERVGDVPDHRVKGHGRDRDGPRPGRVLVRAGDRHRGEEVHRAGVGDPPCDRTGDQRVGRQRQVRAVLLETPDRKNRDLL